jgi:Polysulphide reductase, NrfD
VTEQLQVPPAEFQSYYGRPILKVPRWREPHLPAYLFLGGLSGAAAVMGAAAAATGRAGLARTGRLTAAGAAFGGTAFLIAELGRPERFLHMLRVAKPTSPMSMGSWLLAAHSGLAAAAAGSELTGLLPAVGAAAGAASAATGPLLATYTGVLLADTAVPAWHQSRRQLPLLFAGSAMASAAAAGLAGSAVQAGGAGGSGGSASTDRRPAIRLAVAGAAMETAVAVWLERQPGLTGEPFRIGSAGQWLRAAQVLTPAGAAVALAAGRSRVAAGLAAGLLTAGAVATRVGVFRAGVASAADPKYVVASQRPVSQDLSREAGRGPERGPGGAGAEEAGRQPARTRAVRRRALRRRTGRRRAGRAAAPVVAMVALATAIRAGHGDARASLRRGAG